MLFRVMLIFMFYFGSAMAEVSVEKTESAVADILFDNELDEFATYNIDEDGLVDITFPNNMPDNVFGKVVRELKTHKDIDSVLPGRGGPACSLY